MTKSGHRNKSRHRYKRKKLSKRGGYRHWRQRRRRYTRGRIQNKSKGHFHKYTRKSRSLKRENCSPKPRNKTLPFTCYSPDALYKLKTVWNARHPDQKIVSSSPKQIWTMLKNYMQESCKTESCWLKQQCIKHDLDKSLINDNFAPSVPKEWERKSNEWLSSVDIQRVMSQWEKANKSFRFIGPSPIDYDTHIVYNECVWEELCKFSLKEYIRKKIKTIGVIFNLDKHTQEGSHWVALFIDLIKDKIFYFDSYGDKIPRNILKFCKNVKQQGKELGRDFEIVINKRRHQYSESECGMYCLYFIIQMMNGTPFETFQKKKIPDSLMFEKRKKYYNHTNQN